MEWLKNRFIFHHQTWSDNLWLIKKFCEPEERLAISSKPIFQKKKSLKRFLTTPFQNNFSHVAFHAYFLHDFFIKCSLINILSMDKLSMSYRFPCQYIKQNVLLSSYLDSYDVINFRIYLGSSSKPMKRAF